MKYLDQMNEEEIPSTEEGNDYSNKNTVELFDDDLCERLITYDANANNKTSKAKKTSSCK